MKKILFHNALFHMLLMLAAFHGATAQATPKKFTPIPQHNAAFRKYLPHLYNALRARNTNGIQLLEYFDHLIKTNHATTTWHLAQNQQRFIGDLLQTLDTIAAEQNTSKASTCFLHGDTGTLPALLLTAGLFRIGKQDVDLQLIGNQSAKAINNLNYAVRKNMLAHNDRFHVNQTNSVDNFIATSSRNLRHPNTLFIFAQDDGSTKITEHFERSKPRIFNFVRRTLE